MNRERVGMYGPRELLVAGLGEVRWRSVGWDRIRCDVDGKYYRVERLDGSGVYPETDVGVEDLEGVVVVDVELRPVGGRKSRKWK